MSLGPTATSVMQAYGLPSAFSTEQEVRSKTARRVAPTAVEVNSEGVVQLDGLATRGMFMSGGPQIMERTVTVLANDAIAATLTAQQLVDGIVVCSNAATCALTLPSVTAINAYLNSNLVSSAPQLTIAPALAAQVAPRTCFKLTVFTNSSLSFVTPLAAPAGHGGVSGYQRLSVPDLAGGDCSITTSIAVNTPATGIVIPATLTTTPRFAAEIYFVQTLGVGTDPEWLFIAN